MIEFDYTTDFKLENEEKLSTWIQSVIQKLGFQTGEILYHFVDDASLHKLNVEFLNHDTLTDILSFDYSLGKEIHGEIFISTDRVRENAQEYKVEFSDEIHRVMIHGILHYCGIKDGSEKEASEMREKEDWALSFLKGE